MSESAEVIKARIGLQKIIQDSKEIQGYIYEALRGTIQGYKTGEEVREEYGLLDNVYIFQLVDKNFNDWYAERPSEELEEIEGLLRDSTELKKYLHYLTKRFGVQAFKQQDYSKAFMQYIDKLRSKGVEEAEADDEPMEEESEQPAKDYSSEITTRVSALMKRLESIYRSCFELERADGVLLPTGCLEFKQVKTTTADGKTTTVLKLVTYPGTLFQSIYKAIVNNLTGVELRIPQYIQTEPSAENIRKYNYYPLTMYRYAIGRVGKKAYNDWGSFKEALQGAVEEKFNEYAEAGLLDTPMSEIEDGLSSCILLLKNSPSEGYKFRISIPRAKFDIEGLEESLHSIPGCDSARVLITEEKSIPGLMDIQIIIDSDKFFSKPSWAYKALEVTLGEGKAPSLTEGLPIGSEISGKIAKYKLNPSSGFMTYLAAGSGAGKGVLTLSLLASAIGSGIPVFYVDCKPDMAELFWELSKKYGVSTFAYDGGTTKNPNSGVVYSTRMPKEVQGVYSDYAGVLHYLKCLEVMLALARARATGELEKENERGYQECYFVFDECEAVQGQLVELSKVLVGNTKSGVQKSDPSLYEYSSKLVKWLSELSTELGYYIKTSGRKSSVYSLFIAQDTNTQRWKSLPLGTGSVEMFTQVLTANTVHKILGKGCTGKYGLDGAKLADSDRALIEGNRFFIQFDGSEATPETAQLFKPFLTLNTDDPNAGCWRNGIGKEYMLKDGTEGDYYKALAKEFKGVAPYINKYGMHTGTGFEGLSLMYCQNNTEQLREAIQSSHRLATRVLKEYGGVYQDIDEFVYDLGNYQSATEVTQGVGLGEEEDSFCLTGETDLELLAGEDIYLDEDGVEEPIELGDMLGEDTDVLDLLNEVGATGEGLDSLDGLDLEIDGLSGLGLDLADDIFSDPDVSMDEEQGNAEEEEDTGEKELGNAETEEPEEEDTGEKGLGNVETEEPEEERVSEEDVEKEMTGLDIAEELARCSAELQEAIARVASLSARFNKLSEAAGKKYRG